jgi:anthranilate phosphoribosyltransferase
MKHITEALINRQTLTREEAASLLQHMTNAAFTEAELAAILTVFRMRAITAQELLGFHDAMMEQCVPIRFPGFQTMDIVGSGGDGKNTFNISTLACFVVAACGIPVTKHGNYGVSSISGSSNVLERSGLRFTAIPEVLEAQLTATNICFLHAPLFHPALKAVAQVRQSLKLRTLFNLLGPLVNPSRPAYQLIGTCNLQLARLYREVLNEGDRMYTLVHNTDGYDEITLTAPCKIWTPQQELFLEPGMLQLPTIQPDALYGGDTPEAAATLFRTILRGKGTPAQQTVVCINAACAIHMVTGEGLSAAYQRASAALSSGAAYEVYQQLLQFQQQTHATAYEHHSI